MILEKRAKNARINCRSRYFTLATTFMIFLGVVATKMALFMHKFMHKMKFHKVDINCAVGAFFVLSFVGALAPVWLSLDFLWCFILKRPFSGRHTRFNGCPYGSSFIISTVCLLRTLNYPRQLVRLAFDDATRWIIRWKAQRESYANACSLFIFLVKLFLKLFWYEIGVL